MDKEVLTELNDNLALSQLHFEGELNKLRTGRAHPSMVEDVMVEAYGVKTPLKQLSTISTPEPQLIQISPFDPTTMADIASAIRNNPTLGLNPVDDGRIVRIQIPALTTERRQQIVKQLGEKQEDANIGIRKARQDAMSTIDKAKKDKTIGEDDAKRMQSEVESAISNAKSKVETMSKAKEQEIMTV
ncbi:MAG: ribosome recycling factor [Candidatus Saccharimonadales bacterium]|jgi:ribosome recycling factor